MESTEVVAPECHVWRAVLDDGSVVNVPIERIVDRHGVTWWRGVGSLVRCDTDRRAAMFALGPDGRDHLVELRAPVEKTTVEQLDAMRAELATFTAAVRRERAARAAWLASLPDGSCGNPPPQELIDAETATGEVLATMEGSTP